MGSTTAGLARAGVLRSGSATVIAMMIAGSASAAPTTPSYSVTFHDAVTGDPAPTRTTTAANLGQINYLASGNGGRFTNSGGSVVFDIDQFQPGSVTQRADDYLRELYERPTDQTYFNQSDTGGNIRFGLDSGGGKYYSYLDIENAQVGFDNQYLYVSIDLLGRNSISTGSGSSKRGKQAARVLWFSHRHEPSRSGISWRILHPLRESHGQGRDQLCAQSNRKHLR